MAGDPDPELLRRFGHGDRDAFETLFRQFERDVFRWVLRIVRDPAAAEDVVIESFWRAYRGRARFDAGRSFGPWMRRIATNVARDHLAAAHHRPAPEPITHEVAAPARDAGIADAVSAAFDRLSPKLKLIATLALIEQRPYDEIAEALDVPLGTVKSRVFRAIRALRVELARLGIKP